MASVAKQGAKTLIASGKPIFTTGFDLLHKTNLFSIEVADHEGKRTKVSLNESEMENGLKEWKKQFSPKQIERVATVTRRVTNHRKEARVR
jgi:hypothetical protein